MADLDPQKQSSRQEVPFRVSLAGILDAYWRLTYKTPVKLFQTAARKTDDMTKHMMTGPAAVVTMPAGIILRNGVRVANDASDHGGYHVAAQVAGVAGAAAGWWIAGAAAYGYLATTLDLTGTVGTIGAAIAAAVVTAPVINPAFTAATLGGATLLGTAAGAISTLGAAMNLKVAFLRSVDAWKGVKYDAATLKSMKEAVDKDSLSARAKEEHFQKLRNDVVYLSEDHQKQILEDLKTRFEASAAPVPRRNLRDVLQVHEPVVAAQKPPVPPQDPAP